MMSSRVLPPHQLPLPHTALRYSVLGGPDTAVTKDGNGKRLTALAARARGRLDAGADVDRVACGGLDGVLGLLERFARHDPVDV